MFFSHVRLWFLSVATLCWGVMLVVSHSVRAESLTALGQRLYEQGIDASGKPLTGVRFDKSTVSGADAACINCHRKSGMGGVEGTTVVTPINAEFLFHRTKLTLAIVDPRIRMGFNFPQKSYTEDGVKKAITQGIKVDGSPLGSLMPRYTLDRRSADAIVAYLKTLSSTLSPGIGKDYIQFATVIAPGVDEENVSILRSVMKGYVNRHNLTMDDSVRHHRASFDVYPRVPREWRMEVWELKGQPKTWPGQLQMFYRKNPAFALISGLILERNQEVHDFCEKNQVPCLFPSANAPPERESRYNIYFNRGVALEADILADHLSHQTNKPGRVVQVVEPGEVAAYAAKSLTRSLSAQGIASDVHVLTGDGKADLQKVFSGVTPQDVIMAWLDPDALTRLHDGPAFPEVDLYLSGLMTGGEYSQFSDRWKHKALFVYPFEVGAKRINQEAPLYGWTTTNQIPGLNERLQSESFYNLLLLSEAIGQMLNNLYREYLIERVEDILSMGFNKSIYPSMSLAANQRFASKSGYIVRVKEDNKLQIVSERITP